MTDKKPFLQKTEAVFLSPVEEPDAEIEIGGKHQPEYIGNLQNSCKPVYTVKKHCHHKNG